MKKTIKCEYPHCQKKSEKQQYIKSNSKKYQAILFKFCQYHTYIMMGNHFTSNAKKELKGSFQTVELIEQVIGAIKMIEFEKKTVKK